MSSRFLSRFLLSILVLPVPLLAEEPASLTEADFLSNSRRLTFTGRRAGEGYFSPDGRMLVFQSERDPNNPFFQIFKLDLQTGDTWQVSPGNGKTTCAFIQPGTGEVLFGSTHHDPEAVTKQQEELAFRESGQERRYAWDYDPWFDIWVSGPRGENPRRLTDARGYDAEAAFSPDGKMIVFCSMRDAYNRDLTEEEEKLLALNPSYFGEIYVMNADGTNQTRLTNTDGYDGGPFFSPDGTRIVWRRFDEKGFIADIWTMNIDGTDQYQVTDFGCMSWAPYYHSSGDYIIFAANKLGFTNFELFMVDSTGMKEPVRVTYTDGFDGLPVFSPDGTRLIWTSTRHGGAHGQLFSADWNHEAALRALDSAPPKVIEDP